MKSYRSVITLVLILAASGLAAQENYFTPDIFVPASDQVFEIGMGGEAIASEEFTSREFFDFSYNSEYFGFVAAASFNQDDKYTPDKTNLPDRSLFSSYFLMDQGAMVFRGLDMQLEVGRKDHQDVVDTPYSLFISSKNNPALLANFRYENDFAFYETRWMELNSRSGVATPAFPAPEEGGNYFPDRGAQLKTYGFKLGGMRFGFQDAAVYTERSFDLEYFVSPLPNYLIQYVKGTEGRPWSTDNNENDIMGFFWDWTPDDDLYLNAQVLIDDLNVFGIADTLRNPWKAAYTLGARWQTEAGTFGLYHALATKYTFAPTRDSTNPVNAYSYTYYPDTRFLYSGSDYSAISVEDMMIGYYNGENNIALRFDYDTVLKGTSLATSLEFVVSGPKSPANAWHEETWYPEPGTKLLDTSTLEKKLVLKAQGSRRFGNFVGFSTITAGVAINALELQPGVENYVDASVDWDKEDQNANIWIWRPGDSTEFTWSLSLGLRYEIPVMKALGREGSSN
jgi:hypothetical protein